jgi:hypothetical protein
MKKFFGIIVGLIFGITTMAQEQVDFKVVVPASWKLITYSAEENLWAYESVDGNHQLTVSILYYSKEPTHIQQGQFLTDFLKARQKQSSKIGVAINYSEIDINEYESAWVAKFNEASLNGRIATNKAISSKIGIANFYFESFSSSEVHDKISSEILSTTGFAS